ncbi:MAG: beta-ketoacyl synthase chain length factor [Bacteroidales bacterium]|nr:beta-ketoacyl synthase chain length factor [Bacteroidales bacterium]
MELYFNAASAISPLGSFENESISLQPPDRALGYFVSREPDYRNTIDKKLLRRMSKFIKMAVAGSVDCLAAAGLEQPDAIITGTGLGCLTDTIDFLQQMNENAETLLNPTAFMQSTHNTASGQIALLLGCKNLNITFSQKNISFESALLHAKMMLNGDGYRNILVGGIDEITPESHGLISQTSCMRKFEGEYPVTAGEGAAFFILSNRQTEKTLARFDGISIFNGAAADSSFSDSFSRFFDESCPDADHFDLLITGSHPSDEVYHLLSEKTGDQKILRFKDYCGEYDTSTSFALWLALELIGGRVEGSPGSRPERVLIHNQGSGPCHSLLKVTAC